MTKELQAELLGAIKRIEELASYPVGHSGAWQEVQSQALRLQRSLPSGMEGDLATKISYAVSYVVGAPAHQEGRERGKLTDYLWRLRAILQSAKTD